VTAVASSNIPYYPLPTGDEGGPRTPKDNAVTVGHRQSQLFRAVTNAARTAELQNWDQGGASPVDSLTTQAAIQLAYALPTVFDVPVVTPETTGEIAFEWYKDRHHVAVVAVDGEFIRWSAIAGTTPFAGCEPFRRALPPAALEAILAIVS